MTLAFRDGRVDARDQGESTSGTYTVAGDKACVAFEAERWGRACYFVEPTAGARAQGLEIRELPSDVTGPLTILKRRRAIGSLRALRSLIWERKGHVDDSN